MNKNNDDNTIEGDASFINNDDNASIASSSSSGIGRSFSYSSPSSGNNGFPTLSRSSSAPSSSSNQGTTQNFMFPPTIIINNGNVKNTNYPNINMIIFQILITLYDFAHDHIKSIDRIIADVDNSFLGSICQKSKKQKLAGGGQHGGQINKKIEDILNEYEQECFLDVKNDLYFILSSVISYMDMKEILKYISQYFYFILLKQNIIKNIEYYCNNDMIVQKNISYCCIV
jgi:hypothetical protein